LSTARNADARIALICVRSIYRGQDGKRKRKAGSAKKAATDSTDFAKGFYKISGIRGGLLSLPD
jgi:hypothetical protein